MATNGSGNDSELSLSAVATDLGDLADTSSATAALSNSGKSQASTSHAAVGSYLNADNIAPYGPKSVKLSGITGQGA